MSVNSKLSTIFENKYLFHVLYVNAFFFPGLWQLCPQVSYAKLWNKKLGSGVRRSTVAKASMDAESSESDDPIAPLQLESPIGQFLTQILVSHPHLVPAAVEQQLEQLQIDRDAEGNKEASGSGTDLVLYR